MEDSIAPDIQELPSVSRLPETARHYLQSRLHRYYFNAGDIIVQQGRRGQFMGIIGHGLVDLETPEGDTRTLLPGQILGEEMMVKGISSPFKAIARSEASLWVLTRANWLTAIQFPSNRSKQRLRSKRSHVSTAFFAVMVLIILAVLILSPELPRFASRTLTGALLGMGRPDWVEAYLANAVKIIPDLAEGYEALGYSLFLQGKHTEAESAFEKAVTSDPSSASAQNNLGVALIKTGDPLQAVDHLKSAAELDPGNSEIFFNLGNAFMAVGDKDSALDAYRRAAELDEKNLQAKVQWASLLMESGDLTQAKTIWEQVLVDSPDNPIARRARGVIAVLENQPEASLGDLQAALASDPLDATAHLYLGLAWEALNQPSAAATELAAVQMLTKDPALIELAQVHLQRIAVKNAP